MLAAVLGATGFIGGHIVRALNNAKIDVRVVRRSSGPSLALKDLTYDEMYGDLDDADSLKNAFQDVDVVFNTAGYYPIYSLGKQSQIDIALSQINNFIEAISESKVKKVIYTSAMSTMGYNPHGLSDENTPYDTHHFKGTYYEMKYAVEQELLKAASAGTPIVIVNPTGIFGDHDVKPTSGQIIVAIAKKQFPAVIQAKANVIDVRDVAKAQVAAIHRGKVGERYILGSHNTDAITMCEMIAKIAQVDPPKIKIPLPLAEGVAMVSEVVGKIFHQEKPALPLVGIHFLKYGMHYDCQKAIRELGLTSTPIEETFDRALRWFGKNGYL